MTILTKQFHLDENLVPIDSPAKIHIAGHALSCAIFQLSASLNEEVGEIDFEHPAPKIALLFCGPELCKQCLISTGSFETINLLQQCIGIPKRSALSASSLDNRY
ncbi:hypothetical protein EBB06_08830 [Crenobacter cavernae]|uniref:Uncharacterized protein n=1 Tax=Crenobacter cavernae TaxID=2290923 RepID=A0ABY0FC74_9NEIS|nr:hypothetical protein EBB06_08830 [Crenobacter cavernae]